MAPLAERFVRLRIDSSGFPGELKKALTGPTFTKMGAAAGNDWAKGFVRTAQATLSRTNFKVKVEADLSNFKVPTNQKAIKVPFEPDTERLKNAPATRVPKIPVELDPLTKAFQSEVRRQTAALAKQVALKVPVTPETAQLRDDIADKLRTVERQVRMKVPAGPDARGFETDLRALIREVESQVRLSLPVEPDGAAAAGRQATRVANAAAGPINLKVNSGGGGLPGMGAILPAANAAAQAASTAFNTAGKSASTAAGSVAQLGGSLSSLAGPIGTAVGIGAVAIAISALPAIALAASSALFVLGGALASLPALGVGLGAIVGTLGLGFRGLGDHFKDTAKAGGGAAKSMSAVRAASRGVVQAQRELLKATRDIDKARADEIERIDDLGRALRGSQIDERDAAAAVAEARAELAAARGAGDANAIGAAERALDRSILTLDEARDRTGDLASEQKKAAKVGVDGSDQVQQALERQRDATERLQAAQEALTEAQKSGGGGGGLAQQLTKIAPAAKEVIDKLKALKPVFEDIRLSVQQELFKGVAPELQRLADAWKQPLKDTLTSYAGTINGLFLNLGASVREPTFIKNITSAAETFRVNFDKVGKAVSGPLVDAFGRLARAAEPFINMLGDKVAGLVTNFADWIKSADESGKLDKFMKDAAGYLQQIWDIGGNVLGLFGDIFGIFFESKNQGGAKDYLDGLNKQLLALREWLKDPENKQRIKDVIEKFGEFVKNAEKITLWIVEKGLPALSDLWTKIDEGKEKFDKGKQKIDEWIEKWKTFKDIVLAPFHVGMGMFDAITSAFRRALENSIALFNSLNLGLKFNLSGTGATVSGSGKVLAPRGLGAGLPALKNFAEGGVVRATPGGTIGRIAEAGKTEAVAPIDTLQAYIVDAVDSVLGQSTTTTAVAPVVQVRVYIDSKELKGVAVEAITENPDAVAKANARGAKRWGYAG